MTVVYFKTGASSPVGLRCSRGRKIDFAELGRVFELVPTTIRLNGLGFFKEELKSVDTWEEIEADLVEDGGPLGEKGCPILVTGESAVSTGGERSAKRLKTSGNGFSEKVNKVMETWELKISSFLDTYKENGCKLPTLHGVPCDHMGHPSILLDKLTDHWTKDIGVLWDKAKGVQRGVVPVIGVSGSGKTRFLYELLAETWGFFWTAKTKGNGGSDDVDTVISREIGRDKEKNHMKAMERMRCAILSRLLILQFCVKEIPDLTPLQWLMLQVQWRTFSGTDLYDSLTLDLANMVSDLEDPEVLHDSIGDLWTELERKLKCSFIVVMDEAQVLGNKNTSMYASPESQELRSIFSPIIKALKQPSKKLLERKVFVSGTGVSFLKLEDDIGSVIAKEGGAGRDPVEFVSAPFSSWTDVPQVREFCRDYLKLEDGHEEDNCQYLLEKFRGRRRCLVSCVERLLRLAGGTWKKSIVDDYFKEITSDNNHATSIYYAVRHLCESKGTFVLNGRSVNGAFLVQTIGYSCFYAGSDVFTVSSDRDMTLLERGLGQLTGTSGSKSSFTIFEPTVLESIKNYLKTTVSLQKSIKDLMGYCRGNSSALGREFEKLFTFHVPKLFDGTKLLADMCCFKDATLPPEFSMGKATITGNDEGVWTESYSNHTVSEFLDAEEKSRPQCLIFEDLSGADVLFVVRLGNLKIPVFCQLKLRKQVNWAEAEATTDPKLMYKKKEHVDFRKRVRAACKNGCISLVVAYPATKPDTCEPKCNDNRLVGYIGKKEMTILFGDALCDFLSSIKDGRGQHL